MSLRLEILYFKGIHLAKKIDKMGMRGSDTAVIYLEDVKVPAVNVIGDPGMGFSYQMIQVRFDLNMSEFVQPCLIFFKLNQIWPN